MVGVGRDSVNCADQPQSRIEGCIFERRTHNDTELMLLRPTDRTFAGFPLDMRYARWVQVAHDARLLTAFQISPERRWRRYDPLTRALASYRMVRAKKLSLP